MPAKAKVARLRATDCLLIMSVLRCDKFTDWIRNTRASVCGFLRNGGDPPLKACAWTPWPVT